MVLIEVPTQELDLLSSISTKRWTSDDEALGNSKVTHSLVMLMIFN